MNPENLTTEEVNVEATNVETTDFQETKVLTMNNTLEGFVYMDNVGKILDIALATEENVILFGKGGYGKSEFTLEFLREQGIEPYVITMGSGMTTDRLFGGLDLQKFNDTGKIEYLVENSFMNHEYVVFEELFDSPDFILEQLKDILSSGCFRNGTQMFQIKTKLIICCTNKTREEFAKNNSLRALMERFPLEFEVKWDNHNCITYEKLLQTKLGFADPMLTYILERFAASGNTISPRIAIKAAKIIAQCGPEALSFVADFSGKPEILKNAISQFKSLFDIQKYLEELNELSEEFKGLSLKSEEEIKEGTSLNTKIFALILKLKAVKADDTLVKTVADAIKGFTDIHGRNQKKLELVTKMAGLAFDPTNL